MPPLLLFFAIWAGRASNAEFVLYAVVVLGLAGGLAWLHVRVGLPVALLWCLSVWGLAHMLGGPTDSDASDVDSGRCTVAYAAPAV